MHPRDPLVPLQHLVTLLIFIFFIQFKGGHIWCCCHYFEEKAWQEGLDSLPASLPTCLLPPPAVLWDRQATSAVLIPPTPAAAWTCSRQYTTGVCVCVCVWCVLERCFRDVSWPKLFFRHFSVNLFIMYPS